jgi:hypothetical protein
MPPKFDRCVEKVRKHGGAKNPYAVCRAQLGTDKQIMAREKRAKKEK